MSEPTTDVRYVTAETLAPADGIRHGFFTRRGGVSNGIFASLNAGLGSGDDRALVEENRCRITDALGANSGQLASPYQVHSSSAVYTTKPWHEERPEADGVVTDQPGLVLGIVTADCGPVLFADSEAGVIGAAHAGWKGALNGVLENTIERMIEHGAKRSNICAALGPTISAINYEVGPEFPAPFLEQSGDNQRYFSNATNDGHHMFDLPAYIVDRLTNAGVAASWVGLCTYQADDQFFSYRRKTHLGEVDYGRQLSAIVLA